MRHAVLLAVASAGSLLLASAATAQNTACTDITALPATITQPGVYCLRQDLTTTMTSGNAITINANSVTIDFNGYRLGGLGAGPTTLARGVYALDRKNIALRNGNIRGFFFGIAIDETIGSDMSSGHLIEDNLLEANTYVGIRAAGSGLVVRGNRIINTDSTPPVLYAGATTSSDMFGGVAPQAGTGSSVYGIIARARDSQIIDNLVGATISSDGNASGIFVATGSSNVEIARNTISNTMGDSASAAIVIESASQPPHKAIGNVILGVSAPSSNAYGIAATFGGVICLDNTIAAVDAAQTADCDAEAGTFPPSVP